MKYILLILIFSTLLLASCTTEETDWKEKHSELQKDYDILLAEGDCPAPKVVYETIKEIIPASCDYESECSAYFEEGICKERYKTAYVEEALVVEEDDRLQRCVFTDMWLNEPSTVEYVIEHYNFDVELYTLDEFDDLCGDQR